MPQRWKEVPQTVVELYNLFRQPCLGSRYKLYDEAIQIAVVTITNNPGKVAKRIA